MGALTDIENELPLTLEYAEDARHTWPERWKLAERRNTGHLSELNDYAKTVFRLRKELAECRAKLVLWSRAIPRLVEALKYHRADALGVRKLISEWNKENAELRTKLKEADRAFLVVDKALIDKSVELGNCKAKLAETEAKVLRVLRGEFGQICSYCGWETAPSGGAWQELQDHIKVCPEHPLPKAEARCERLREALRKYGEHLHWCKTNDDLERITLKSAREG